MDGFNPMRWNCLRDGCFNFKCRPKIERFADCFPRRINFGDVDGLVEVGGAFCLLEWKGDGGRVHLGQRRAYKRFTEIPGNSVFIVNGNAETMEIYGYAVVWKGQHKMFVPAQFADLKARLRGWAKWADVRKENTAA